ncbi:MAG: thiamine biosynthesis protein, partial [Desulfobulbales bacterium]|nr:thiamine biosynthesis protein [Desulfobulbales bacterium]
QRPMSQRRDALRVIERDSSCEGILVRPLCAKNLAPTQAELDGLIDREQLLAFTGRTRIPQMKLAEQFGIKEYPSPAGGCTLTDPVLGDRVQKYYQENKNIMVEDIMLLLLGRQFYLKTGGWLVVGRNEKENKKIEGLLKKDDWLLKPKNIPGPSAILRHNSVVEELQTAAAIVLRYAKKSAVGQGPAEVTAKQNDTGHVIETSPLDNTTLHACLKN